MQNVHKIPANNHKYTWPHNDKTQKRKKTHYKQNPSNTKEKKITETAIVSQKLTYFSLSLWKRFESFVLVFCIIENKNYDVILLPDNRRGGRVEPTNSAEQDDDVIDTDGWDFAAPSELLLESSSTVKNGVEIEEDY